MLWIGHGTNEDRVLERRNVPVSTQGLGWKYPPIHASSRAESAVRKEAQATLPSPAMPRTWRRRRSMALLTSSETASTTGSSSAGSFHRRSVARARSGPHRQPVMPCQAPGRLLSRRRPGRLLGRLVWTCLPRCVMISLMTGAGRYLPTRPLPFGLGLGSTPETVPGQWICAVGHACPG